jgi:hypothetical protein
MARYEVLLNDYILDKEKNRTIPNDPNNGHYKQYLEWRDVPNTPDYETVDLDALKEKKCGEIKNYLINTKYKENFLYDVSTDTAGSGDAWQVDIDSQKEITHRGMLALASNADSTTFPWAGDDKYWTNNESPNVEIEFTTADKFLLFSNAVRVHCQVLYKQAKVHKAAVRALHDRMVNYAKKN